MTESEARFLTDRIKTAVVRVYELLFEAHEGGAWAALGYRSFREYVAGEFDMSRARAYQLLNQAKVVREISAAVSTDVDIPEAAARELGPALPSVVERIRQQLGTVPAEDAQLLVDRLVEEEREHLRRRQRWDTMREENNRRVAEALQLAEEFGGRYEPPSAPTRDVPTRLQISAPDGRQRWAAPPGLTVDHNAVVGPDSRITGIADAATLDAHHSAWGALKVLQDLDLARVVGLLTPAERQEYLASASALGEWLFRYGTALERLLRAEGEPEPDGETGQLSDPRDN
jgi:hypothetical protein